MYAPRRTSLRRVKPYEAGPIAPLQVGDEVMLSVEGIGALSHRILAGVEPIPVPPVRRLSAQLA
jgi:hypothetical protein